MATSDEREASADIADLLRETDFSHLQLSDRRLLFMAGIWHVITVRKTNRDPMKWHYQGDSLHDALVALRGEPKRSGE